MFEKVNFEGWPNCIRLYNKNIELVLTTDVGPRIIRFGYVKKQNLLYVSANDAGKSGGNDWRIYGGHRLWHAPEASPRSYCPDNNPVGYSWNGKTLILSQDPETTTGIVKEMEITLHPDKNHVIVLHRLINNNLWPIETSPWAITAHAAGGRAILPQEPYIDPADYLLPARPVVLWYYTHMDDPRWIWGNKYIQLMHESKIKSEQKIGILNKQGWAAYLHDKTLMIKKFQFDPEALYPDYGCNNEVYVNGNLLEIETLGQLAQIAPGSAVEHTEQWLITTLEQAKQPVHDDGIDRNILPVIRSFMI
jgi:hypothetical protein